MVGKNTFTVNENNVLVGMAEPFSDKYMHKRTDRMLLRQKDFPYRYQKDRDVMIAKTHNQCLAQDRLHAGSCFERYARTSEMNLGEWIRKASDEDIFVFLKNILKADQTVDWTGYRVMVSKDQSGYPIWMFELFSKHPESTIGVYSGQKAPNVMLGPRG